jgi:hypothetical protein
LEDQLRDALQREANPAQAQRQNANSDHDDDDDDDQNEGDENQPVFNLPPPPESNYANEDELEKFIHSWSLEHGYELVRRASKKNAGGRIYKRYYHCSKHGKVDKPDKVPPQNRVRAKRKTNRMGCPMSLAAVAVDPSNPDGEWQIRHRKTHHSHGPLDAVTMAGHRRRARMGGVEKAVDGLFAIGTPTAQVLTFLQRTNPDGLFTRTDVANMKLKFKKYGTCQHVPMQYSKDPDKTTGFPSACMPCRAKKTRCDSVRPVCGTCTQNGHRCEYDHEPGALPRSMTKNPPPGTAPPTRASSSAQATPVQADESAPAAPSTTVTPTPAVEVRRRGPTQLAQNRLHASQILADLQQFQNEYVKPKRLDINGSTVEILAHSSCGNGDSYKNIPTLYVVGDWQTYSDAFLEASLKENTHDVLIGLKPEPVRPEGRAPGEGDLGTGVRGGGDGEIDVEVWNEYIRQLAIFNRRNQALLGALWGSLAPSFRTRTQGFKKAAEAWRALEEMCRPHGSDQAWKLFNELHSVTLESCSNNLLEYSTKLETKYAEFSRLRLSQQHPHDRSERYNPRIRNGGGGLMTGADVISEDAICLLFLRNLGEGYKRWVDTLCLTSNIGGFGTGLKLSFRDLVKRAEEIEGLGGRSGGGG